MSQPIASFLKIRSQGPDLEKQIELMLDVTANSITRDEVIVFLNGRFELHHDSVDHLEEIAVRLRELGAACSVMYRVGVSRHELGSEEP